MGRKRDSKGRFIKGNEIGRENLKPFTREQAAEMGRKGAEKANETKRRNKMLKEVMKDVLLEEVEMVDSSGRRIVLTKQEVIVQKVLNRLQKTGTTKDLKYISDMLGESEINVNVRESERPTIVFTKNNDEDSL